jgi:hypothetical protein
VQAAAGRSAPLERFAETRRPPPEPEIRDPSPIGPSHRFLRRAHLLNPDVISLSSIRIAEKDGSGEVKLVPINEHKGSILERRSAYQPVLDALQIRPFKIDLANDAIVIVEGMIDYYLIDMFRRGQVLKILPSVGAESIMFYISIMIAWRIPYRALWDNDSAGRRSREIAAKHFGDREAIKFRLLPVGEKKTAKRIMQDLVAGEDLVQIRTLLGIPSDTDFAKTITTLYYSSERTKILDVVSNRTWSGFDNLFASLEIEGQSP